MQCLLHSAEFAAVLRCSFIVPVLCLLFYTVALLSLQIAVLDISFPLPAALTAGFLVQGLFLFIWFIYSFIYLCFPPLSHLALVWQVLRGGLEQGTCSWIAGWVGQCSSTLGCDCSCSSWAPWASSLHLWCGCLVTIFPPIAWLYFMQINAHTWMKVVLAVMCTT